MSPEQARGEKLDSRTDLFSFGAVLFEMATGRQAFPGETSALVFDAILNREPVSVSVLNPRIPQKLEEIIDKALEKDPKLRYQNASDLRTDLMRLKRDTESGRQVFRAAGVGTADTATLDGVFERQPSSSPRSARPEYGRCARCKRPEEASARGFAWRCDDRLRHGRFRVQPIPAR